jgi:orotidine-5'-phosphate decarboxylase
LAALRQLLPEVIFLVPGYGTQGGTAADTVAAFRGSAGAVVNSSRGVIFAFSPQEPAWEAKIEVAAKKTITELGAALK